MRLAILGTGNVAQMLARRLSETGHEVTFGSRDPASKGGLNAPVTSLADAVAGNDVVINATPGAVSLEVAEGIGAAAFAGKVLVDVANANTPSFELVYPNSSLGEKLQAALPDAKVVKTMNTAAMTVMTEPGALPPSSVFVSGDDAAAKATVASLLAGFGWADDSIVDLGGIASARGAEHYSLLFAAFMQSLGSPNFNIRLVR
ncbi:MAG: oxidoreductase [Actinomycetia bacterium]|nr:oxidoreductase [Actinomycetes bacterium]MDX6332794.1 8-hydroxy-5-deazaflavin:NADPH oxidoreductase [Streptosporangiaceae bacterium]